MAGKKQKLKVKIAKVRDPQDGKIYEVEYEEISRKEVTKTSERVALVKQVIEDVIDEGHNDPLYDPLSQAIVQLFETNPKFKD